jgi:threonine/homoserine/homoserine lactone efflux protein
MLPGIDTAQILRAVAIGGKRQAYATLFGIMCGVWIWGIGAALGVSALLLASQTGYTILRWVGALYLFYLGAKMIWESRHISYETIAASTEVKKTFLKTFNKAFLITFTNPKNGAFYVAILPVFLPHEVPAIVGGLILSTLHNLCCLIWFTMMIFGASFAVDALRTPRAQKFIERISGIALIGFGAKLLSEKSR